jgi:hypothetical protein
VLNQQGFERLFNVLTDGTGQFTHTFKPTITDSGLYKVSALHPGMTDRPEQRAFTINRVTVGPTPYALDLPRNYPFTIPFSAKAGPGTVASNLRLVLNAASQPTGQLPAGVSVQPSAPVSLAERQTLNARGSTESTARAAARSTARRRTVACARACQRLGARPAMPTLAPARGESRLAPLAGSRPTTARRA